MDGSYNSAEVFEAFSQNGESLESTRSLKISRSELGTLVISYPDIRLLNSEHWEVRLIKSEARIEDL